MSISTGGFSGDNALLAFAAMQQGRMNEELTESMRSADIRSQMAADIASIKAHLDGANRDFVPGTEEKESFVKADGYLAVQKEIQAFMEKYGEDPACADMLPAMEETAALVDGQLSKHYYPQAEAAAGAYGRDHSIWLSQGRQGEEPQLATINIPRVKDADIQNRLDQLQKTLDAAGTNDQLAMIHIKQLNDNINNSSGMVSGIMESRQNTTASIINNLA